MQGEGAFRFFTETPGFHSSCGVQSFIEQELNKPSKAWVHEVVGSRRESEFVKLRTPDFVLLPDLVAARRQFRHPYREPWSVRCSQMASKPMPRWTKPQYPAFQPLKHGEAIACGAWKHNREAGDFACGAWKHNREAGDFAWNALVKDSEQDGVHPCTPLTTVKATACNEGMAVVKPGCQWPQQQVASKEGEWSVKSLNWLAIVADPSLRSIRDLRGEHVPMLEDMYDQCVAAIQKEYKVDRSDIMVFANYPPSVYKLHFHFCAPFFTSSAYDAFRMHSLSSIINNLKICSDYYKLSSFQVPLHVGSELFRIIYKKADEVLEAQSTTE
jgi:hypothetical protein